MYTVDYKTFFKGKKITMLGLGLLGRGVGVAKFLSQCGAVLIITDLKDPKVLEPSIKKLKAFPNIQFVLGGHNLADFQSCDMVIKAAGVAPDSPYIKEAKKNKIPVEMDASLFAKFSPATLVGVTGTRGKTTTTHLIHHILLKANLIQNSKFKIQNSGRVYLGGNIRGIATLPLLSKVRKGDIVVLELDSWQLQGFGTIKLSPHIAVFTNFLFDHMNYYKGNMDAYFRDKVNIFKYQKTGDILVFGSEKLKVKSEKFGIKSKVCVAKRSSVPQSWKIKILGEHNRENIACAIVVCRALEVSEQDIKRGVETFAGVSGRLELVRTVGGVRYYNDTTATTPDGNRVALTTLEEKNTKNIILIAGGANKGLDYTDMAKLIHKIVKGLILIKGEASQKIIEKLPQKHTYPIDIVSSMKDALKIAHAYACTRDSILLSPGAASFGVFKNEYDRGDQFVALVNKL